VAAVLVLGAAIVTSIGVGAAAITPLEVVRVFTGRLGISGDAAARADGVIWAIRFPRVLLGVVAGAGLAVAGVALQRLFRTPLAEPQLLGLGPGAAIGAVLGAAGGGIQGAVAGGAAAGILSGFAVRRIGRSAEGDPARLVLSGVALGAMFSAWVGFFVFGLDRATVAPIEFWLLGSLSGATWRAFGTATVIITIGVIALVAFGRSLDILSLGEATARSLGIDVPLIQTLVVLAAGLVTGAVTGAVGVIGFVGLLAPAIATRISRPGAASTMGMAGLIGATLLVGADALARTVVSPIELPAGLITSALGGPLFIWLISRMRRWA
jgi:iron complex transport system permease protein